MKDKQNNRNYLDLVPQINPVYDWKTDDKGNVILMVENKGFFNRIAQKFFKKPKVSQIHLDEMGSFIWPMMDGEKSVYVIAEAVKEAFGKEAEPLYERLVKYMRTLESYSFITMKNACQDVKEETGESNE